MENIIYESRTDKSVYRSMIVMNSPLKLTWSHSWIQMQTDHNHTNMHFMGMTTLSLMIMIRQAYKAMISVLVHSGDLSGGHYFAFVKPTKDGRW